MRITAEALTASTFAAFGDVLEAPLEPGRTYFDHALGNLRPGAAPSLSVAHVTPAAKLPVVVSRMERHQYSSQTFVPLDVGHWLIIVASTGRNGTPDPAGMRAFLAGPHHGITFRAATWHHPLTVLDRTARFAIFMWLDSSEGDEEFVSLPYAVEVCAA